MKFGTIIGMVMNSDLTNFGVSMTIAPPTVQKLTFLKVLTFEPFVIEK